MASDELFVKITPEIVKRYAETFALEGGIFKVKYARENPTLMAYYMLGLKPYIYQDLFFHQILNYDRLLIVKARQLGFSTSLAMFSLWACFYNKFPSGIKKNTKIGLISKDDDASKGLLLTIRDMIHMGDKWMSTVLKGRKEWTNTFFSSRLAEPNNSDTITFSNGSVIKSLPPTKKVRSKSFDVVFVDEAAFLGAEDPEKFFHEVIEPTVVATHGKIVVLSTPNGQAGFFYKLADPENIQKSHPYKRFFYHYTVSSDPNYLEFVRMQRQSMDISNWNQEYCCDFTSSSKNFFIPQKVEEAVDEVINQTDFSGRDVVVGIDFGMTHSRTVVSVVLKDSDGLIKVIEVHRFESGEDVNKVLPLVENIRKRYNVVKIVADDCPQGNAIINKMISLGWNVFPFNFTSLKNATYVAFRSFLNNGKVKILKNDDLIREMHELRQEETKQAKLSIHKPNGGTDDVIDSVIMAAKPFLDDQESFKVLLV